MPIHFPSRLAALCATVIFCGCADTETPSLLSGEQFALDFGQDSGTASASDMSLLTAAGEAIEATSLRCLYRQSTGSERRLEVQLQYLSASNGLAFAFYLTNPIPATPFEASAHELERVDFEAYADGLHYRSALEHNEITVQLDSLPLPTSLHPEDPVSLKGHVSIQPFSVPEVSSLGKIGPTTLELASGDVAIDCTPMFQVTTILN